MKFTPEEIAKARELIEKAESKPPYEQIEDGNLGVYLKTFAFRVVGRMSMSAYPGDCAYILYAANNYPDAHAEIERLREELRVTKSKLAVSSGAIILVKETHPELFCDELLANAMNIALEGGA